MAGGVRLVMMRLGRGIEGEFYSASQFGCPLCGRQVCRNLTAPWFLCKGGLYEIVLVAFEYCLRRLIFLCFQDDCTARFHTENSGKPWEAKLLKIERSKLKGDGGLLKHYWAWNDWSKNECMIGCSVRLQLPDGASTLCMCRCSGTAMACRICLVPAALGVYCR